MAEIKKRETFMEIFLMGFVKETKKLIKMDKWIKTLCLINFNTYISMSILVQIPAAYVVYRMVFSWPNILFSDQSNDDTAMKILNKIRQKSKTCAYFKI